MKTTLIAALGLGGLVGALCFTSFVKADDSGPAPSAAVSDKAGTDTPVIQFETNFYDFGKLIAPGKVSGAFKFKNAGTGLLELAPPETSCGCTAAKAKPDRLAPGQSGEITYTINLDHAMGLVQKRITIHSNDPKNPETDLTVQLNYTPLYALDPTMLRTMLPADKSETQGRFRIVRNDGKPLGIARLVTSDKWINAALEAAPAQDSSSAVIDVTIHRPEKPLSLMLGNIQVWTTNEPDRPVQTMYLSCEMQGELSATPSQIYWVIPDFGSSISNYPADTLSRTVELKSISGGPVEIKNATSSITGMNTQIVPKNGGKMFDLVLKFDNLPQAFTSGNVMVQTASTFLPQLKVPVIVSVAPK